MGKKNLEIVTKAIQTANENNWQNFNEEERLLCMSLSPLLMLIAMINPDEPDEEVKK